MMGALTGACLGALLTAKILKVRIPKIMDLILPSLMVFIAIARLGEGYTFLGISRPLVDNAFNHTFLVKFDTDFYLRTYLLESAAAAALFFALFRLNRKQHRDGDTALKGMLYFGVSQTLMESLRYDGHMRFEFIGAQQVFCVLLIAAVTMTASVRLLKQGGKKLFPWIAICGLPVLAGLLIGLEFMIDRSGISRYILYAAYGLVLACQGIVTSILINRSYNIWNEKK
jgi:prolipoprotein diacylglyceryltransferase